MYLDKLQGGDAGYIGEELLSNTSELVQKCEMVEKTIREGYFTLEQSLCAFEVKEIQFVAYLFNKRLSNTNNKEEELINAITFIVGVYEPIIHTLDSSGKSIMQNLKFITERAGAKEFKI